MRISQLRRATIFAVHLVLCFTLVCGVPSDATSGSRKGKAVPKASGTGPEIWCSDGFLAPAEGVPTEHHQSFDEQSLLSLLATDPAKNLLVKHPLVGMNAFQKTTTWVTSLPADRILDPQLGGRMVTVYPTLSEGGSHNSGRFIVGHYEELEAFVDWLKQGAMGDGSRKKMWTFIGPAGTGKTEVSDVINEVGKVLSERSPNHFDFTFKFVGLGEIDSIRDFLIPVRDSETGAVTYQDVPTPFYESPLVMLPRSFQSAALNNVHAVDAAEQMLGHGATPFLERSPPTEFFRSEIIKHYKSKHPDWDWTDDRTVLNVLARHVRLVRWIPGKTVPDSKLDAQGRDIDWSAIFFKENPLVSSIYGSGHPLAYSYNGLLPRSQGRVITLDEFYRNSEALRDTFLGFIESRRISRGATNLPVDVVVIGAANDENVEHVVGEGRAAAQIDRTNPAPFRLQTHPLEVYKLLLVMKGLGNLEQQKLVGRTEIVNDEAAFVPHPLEPVNLKELFVDARSAGQHMTGPDGRYALWLRNGRKDKILFGPHSLSLMAYVTAASRISTDKEQAQQLTTVGPLKVLGDAVFTNADARLKAMTGELPVSPPVAHELRQLANLLREGSKGISQRGASNTWLSAVIAAAKRPENGNTVTPQLVREVFSELLDKKKINFPTSRLGSSGGY